MDTQLFFRRVASALTHSHQCNDVIRVLIRDYSDITRMAAKLNLLASPCARSSLQPEPCVWPREPIEWILHFMWVCVHSSVHQCIHQKTDSVCQPRWGVWCPYLSEQQDWWAALVSTTIIILNIYCKYTQIHKPVCFSETHRHMKRPKKAFYFAQLGTTCLICKIAFEING